MALELRVLRAFAEMTGITLCLHRDKERDTSVVFLVYGPCMVVVVSGVVTSPPSAMIPWACMQNFMIQREREQVLAALISGAKIHLDKSS